MTLSSQADCIVHELMTLSSLYHLIKNSHFNKSLKYLTYYSQFCVTIGYDKYLAKIKM